MTPGYRPAGGPGSATGCTPLARVTLLVTCWAVVPSAVAGQTIQFGVHAVTATYAEVREGQRWLGEGGGAHIVLQFRKFRLEGKVLGASFDPKEETAAAFDAVQLDVHASYAFIPAVALEVGGGRRYVTEPEFAAQEVGALRIGIRSQNPLTRLADIWARGAYLVSPGFSGGGSADLAIELGLGMAVGTANRRFQFTAEYGFQRLDRKVDQVSVPIEMSVGRIGVALGF